MPTPAPIVVGPDSACSNSYSTYSITANPKNKYLWTVTGGAINGSNTASAISVLWGQDGTGSVVIKVTSELGCDSIFVKQVRIMPLPTPVITGPESICAKGSYVYSVMKTKNSKYDWKVDGSGNINGGSSDSAISVSWGTGGHGSLFLTETTKFGCVSSTYKTVTINSLPNVEIQGPVTVCVSSARTFTVKPQTGAKYYWKVNGMNYEIISGSNSNSLTVHFKDTGKYSVELLFINALGCSQADTHTLDVTNLKKPAISGDIIVCNTAAMLQVQKTYKIEKLDINCQHDWALFSGGQIQQITDSSIQIKWTDTGTHVLRHLQQNSNLGCYDSSNFVMRVSNVQLPIASEYSYQSCPPRAFSLPKNLSKTGVQYEWFEAGRKVSSKYDYEVRMRDSGTKQFMVTAKDKYGCTDTSLVNCTAWPMPTADFRFSVEKSITTKDTVNFTNTSSGAIKYLWTSSDGGSDTSIHFSRQFVTPGDHSVKLLVSNKYGCTDSVSKVVPVIIVPEIFIPNAFTPNGSGLNDRFTVYIDNITEFDMMILNRWGEILFKTTDAATGWDGTFMEKLCPDGVYVYLIHAKAANGEKYTFTGTVTLLR